MQEPVRINMLTVVQKSLKTAQRKIFLHRIIYIASYAPNPDLKTQEEKALIILIDSNIKLVNEEYCEDRLTGFGLFYTGYFINIIEGPESALVKHIKILSETFAKNLSKIPQVTRMKILFISYHINRRYFTSWSGRQATPPVLLEEIAPSTSPEVNVRHIQICLLKLYKVFELIDNQPPNLLKATMDNVSDICRTHLPEINLLDFLLDSPGLMGVKDFLRIFESVPDCTLYDETIWPLPPDFVPSNVFEDSPKQIMIFEETEYDELLENAQEGEKTNEFEEGEKTNEFEEGEKIQDLN